MVNFYGCSFVEGGGMDNIIFYNFHNKNKKLKDDLNLYNENENILKKFRNENRFSYIFEKMSNIKTENHALSQSSNEYIFEKLYNHLKVKNNEKFIVCLTLLHRRYWYYEYTNKKYNLNGVDIHNTPYLNNENMIPLSKTFEMYCENIFNAKDEKSKLLMQIDLLNEFSKKNNNKIYWISWSEFDELKNTNKNYIKFENLDMNEFVIKNKLQITDETNGEFNDPHISLHGNKIIGKMIYEYIKIDR